MNISSHHVVIYCLLVSATVTFLITPLLIWFTKKFNIVDNPNARKVHKEAIPVMGGVGIFLGFIAGVLFVDWYVGDWKYIESESLHFLIAATFMVLLGVVDDVMEISAKIKFFFQFLIATYVIFNGYLIDDMTNPFSGGHFELGAFGYVVTYLWIIGITNAINLMDGLDGLASGVTMIACITLLVVSFKINHYFVLIITSGMIGSILAFLKYNFNPAKIFMGDSGSLFLGFSLACVSVQGSQLSATAVSMVIPVMALGVPIVDTLFAMFRRVMIGQSPFKADREHIHHRLINYLGLTHKKAVLVIYGICCFFALMAFVFASSNNMGNAGILAIVFIVVFVGIRKLGYIEFIESSKKKRKIRKTIFIVEDSGAITERFKEKDPLYHIIQFSVLDFDDPTQKKIIRNTPDLIIYDVSHKDVLDAKTVKKIESIYPFNKNLSIFCCSTKEEIGELDAIPFFNHIIFLKTPNVDDLISFAKNKVDEFLEKQR